MLLIFTMVSAFARLGETPDQCAMRYGSSTGRSASDQLSYSRGHLLITVYFSKDRSIREDFAPESGGSLTEAQVVELLQENAEGSSWEVMGQSATATSYMRKDGRATAQRAKPNSQGNGNVKLTFSGAELVIKYAAQ